MPVQPFLVVTIPVSMDVLRLGWRELCFFCPVDSCCHLFVVTAAKELVAQHKMTNKNTIK
jgi:hypothetical protein